MLKRIARFRFQHLLVVEYNLKDLITLIILLAVSIILISNIYRSFERGRGNLTVFAKESLLLEEHRDRNDLLKRELSLMEEKENLILLARESLTYGKPNEEIFFLKEENKLYDLKIKNISFDEIDISSIWYSLLLGG